MCLLGVRCDVWAPKTLFNSFILANCPRRPLCLALPTEPRAGGCVHKTRSVRRTHPTHVRHPTLNGRLGPNDGYRFPRTLLVCYVVTSVGSDSNRPYVCGGYSFSVQGYLDLEDTWKCGCVVVAHLLKASALSARRLLFPHHTFFLS